MKELLKDFDEKKVEIFIAYLNRLATEKDKTGKIIAWWFKNIKKDQFATIFKKVAETGLFIEGENITLNYRGKLLVTYDYHAYKNKVMLLYPESIFDFQIVYENDNFKFSKSNGKVSYTHELNEPFKIGKKIIGAYGIIKNKRGEFIELLNLSDIEKMKNTSSMKNIWNSWYDRMVLKSIIKRICSTHFFDVVKDMIIEDNQTEQPENVSINSDLQLAIEQAETKEQLNLIYSKNKDIVKDKAIFLNLLKKRKNEIK